MPLGPSPGDPPSRAGTWATEPRGTSAPWPTTTPSGGLLDDVLLQSGVTPPVPDLPLGVEVTRRVSGDDAWLFLLNHTEAEQTLTAAGHDLVTDTPVAGTITLAAGAVAVVHEG